MMQVFLEDGMLSHEAESSHGSAVPSSSVILDDSLPAADTYVQSPSLTDNLVPRAHALHEELAREEEHVSAAAEQARVASPEPQSATETVTRTASPEHTQLRTASSGTPEARTETVVREPEPVSPRGSPEATPSESDDTFVQDVDAMAEGMRYSRSHSRRESVGEIVELADEMVPKEQAELVEVMDENVTVKHVPVRESSPVTVEYLAETVRKSSLNSPDERTEEALAIRQPESATVEEGLHEPAELSRQGAGNLALHMTSAPSEEREFFEEHVETQEVAQPVATAATRRVEEPPRRVSFAPTDEIISVHEELGSVGQVPEEEHLETFETTEESLESPETPQREVHYAESVTAAPATELKRTDSITDIPAAVDESAQRRFQQESTAAETIEQERAYQAFTGTPAERSPQFSTESATHVGPAGAESYVGTPYPQNIDTAIHEASVQLRSLEAQLTPEDSLQIRTREPVGIRRSVSASDHFPPAEKIERVQTIRGADVVEMEHHIVRDSPVDFESTVADRFAYPAEEHPLERLPSYEEATGRNGRSGEHRDETVVRERIPSESPTPATHEQSREHLEETVVKEKHPSVESDQSAERLVESVQETSTTQVRDDIPLHREHLPEDYSSTGSSVDRGEATTVDRHTESPEYEMARTVLGFAGVTLAAKEMEQLAEKVIHSHVISDEQSLSHQHGFERRVEPKERAVSPAESVPSQPESPVERKATESAQVETPTQVRPVSSQEFETLRSSAAFEQHVESPEHERARTMLQYAGIDLPEEELETLTGFALHGKTLSAEHKVHETRQSKEEREVSPVEELPPSPPQSPVERTSARTEQEETSTQVRTASPQATEREGSPAATPLQMESPEHEMTRTMLQYAGIDLPPEQLEELTGRALHGEHVHTGTSYEATETRVAESSTRDLRLNFPKPAEVTSQSESFTLRALPEASRFAMPGATPERPPEEIARIFEHADRKSPSASVTSVRDSVKELEEGTSHEKDDQLRAVLEFAGVDIAAEELEHLTEFASAEAERIIEQAVSETEMQEELSSFTGDEAAGIIEQALSEAEGLEERTDQGETQGRVLLFQSTPDSPTGTRTVTRISRTSVRKSPMSSPETETRESGIVSEETGEVTEVVTIRSVRSTVTTTSSERSHAMELSGVVTEHEPSPTVHSPGDHESGTRAVVRREIRTVTSTAHGDSADDSGETIITRITRQTVTRQIGEPTDIEPVQAIRDDAEVESMLHTEPHFERSGSTNGGLNLPSTTTYTSIGPEVIQDEDDRTVLTKVTTTTVVSHPPSPLFSGGDEEIISLRAGRSPSGSRSPSQTQFAEFVSSTLGTTAASALLPSEGDTGEIPGELEITRTESRGADASIRRETQTYTAESENDEGRTVTRTVTTTTVVVHKTGEEEGHEALTLLLPAVLAGSLPVGALIHGALQSGSGATVEELPPSPPFSSRDLRQDRSYLSNTPQPEEPEELEEETPAKDRENLADLRSLRRTPSAPLGEFPVEAVADELVTEAISAALEELAAEADVETSARDVTAASPAHTVSDDRAESPAETVRSESSEQFRTPLEAQSSTSSLPMSPTQSVGESAHGHEEHRRSRETSSASSETSEDSEGHKRGYVPRFSSTESETPTSPALKESPDETETVIAEAESDGEDDRELAELESRTASQEDRYGREALESSLSSVGADRPRTLIPPTSVSLPEISKVAVASPSTGDVRPLSEHSNISEISVSSGRRTSESSRQDSPGSPESDATLGRPSPAPKREYYVGSSASESAEFRTPAASPGESYHTAADDLKRSGSEYDTAATEFSSGSAYVTAASSPGSRQMSGFATPQYASDREGIPEEDEEQRVTAALAEAQRQSDEVASLSRSIVAEFGQGDEPTESTEKSSRRQESWEMIGPDDINIVRKTEDRKSTSESDDGFEHISVEELKDTEIPTETVVQDTGVVSEPETEKSYVADDDVDVNVEELSDNEAPAESQTEPQIEYPTAGSPTDESYIFAEVIEAPTIVRSAEEEATLTGSTADSGLAVSDIRTASTISGTHLQESEIHDSFDENLPPTRRERTPDPTPELPEERLWTGANFRSQFGMGARQFSESEFSEAELRDIARRPSEVSVQDIYRRPESPEPPSSPPTSVRGDEGEPISVRVSPDIEEVEEAPTDVYLQPLEDIQEEKESSSGESERFPRYSADFRGPSERDSASSASGSLHEFERLEAETRRQHGSSESLESANGQYRKQQDTESLSSLAEFEQLEQTVEEDKELPKAERPEQAFNSPEGESMSHSETMSSDTASTVVEAERNRDVAEDDTVSQHTDRDVMGESLEEGELQERLTERDVMTDSLDEARFATMVPTRTQVRDEPGILDVRMTDSLDSDRLSRLLEEENLMTDSLAQDDLLRHLQTTPDRQGRDSLETSMEGQRMQRALSTTSEITIPPLETEVPTGETVKVRRYLVTGHPTLETVSFTGNQAEILMQKFLTENQSRYPDLQIYESMEEHLEMPVSSVQTSTTRIVKRRRSDLKDSVETVTFTGTDSDHEMAGFLSHTMPLDYNETETIECETRDESGDVTRLITRRLSRVDVAAVQGSLARLSGSSLLAQGSIGDIMERSPSTEHGEGFLHSAQQHSGDVVRGSTSGQAQETATNVEGADDKETVVLRETVTTTEVHDVSPPVESIESEGRAEIDLTEHDSREQQRVLEEASSSSRRESTASGQESDTAAAAGGARRPSNPNAPTPATSKGRKKKNSKGARP